MNCEDLNVALVDLVDGRLDGAEQREIERHLEACANCRALVEDMRTIRAAAFMLDRREPKPDTWTKLQAAMAANPQSTRSEIRYRLPVWLAAAAALILATAIGMWPLLNRPAAPHDDSARAAAGDQPPATVAVSVVGRGSWVMGHTLRGSRVIECLEPENAFWFPRPTTHDLRLMVDDPVDPSK